MSLLTPAGDQLVAEGVTHISLPTQEYDRGNGENRRTNEQTKLGVNQEQRKVLQHYMHVRTIASVGYKRKFHHATGIRLILTHCRWTLSHAASPLCCPTANSLLLASAVQPPTALSAVQPPTLSSGSPVNCLSRVPFPLPDTARFHVQESFVWFRAKIDNWIVCFGSPTT